MIYKYSDISGCACFAHVRIHLQRNPTVTESNFRKDLTYRCFYILFTPVTHWIFSSTISILIEFYLLDCLWSSVSGRWWIFNDSPSRFVAFFPKISISMSETCTNRSVYWCNLLNIIWGKT